MEHGRRCILCWRTIRGRVSWKMGRSTGKEGRAFVDYVVVYSWWLDSSYRAFITCRNAGKNRGWNFVWSFNGIGTNIFRRV